MLRNYFRIAWRRLIKDKQSTILNLVGLSTGLACTLLIYLWITDERSVDRWYANDDRLFQLMEKRFWSGQHSVSDESSGLLADAVAKEAPEVAYAAVVAPSGWFPKSTLSVGDRSIRASGQHAGKDYFNIFSYKLIEGSRNNLLAQKNFIVISDDLARRLFNTTQNVVGKTIRLEHDKDWVVSGVFESMPARSSQQFDFVRSFEYLRDVAPWVNEWGNTGPRNYVLLKPGADVHTFNKKIASIIRRANGDTTRQPFASRYSDTYLYGTFGQDASAGGRIAYVRLFSLIAAFILTIACINFMNLSTAKASRRLKEVGIKKVMGAIRSQLVWQFLSESVLLTAISMVLAFLLAAWMLPYFNDLTGKHMMLQPGAKLITVAVSITFLTGLVAGSYPAFYLSGFNPIAVLKGKLAASMGELFVRRGLVVFQFTLSMIFIVAVVVVYRQMHYIQSQNIGYNKDNVLVLNSDGRIIGNQEAFMAALRKLPGVVGATGTTHNLVGHNFSTPGLEWPGKAPDQSILFEVAGIGDDFVPAMNISMAAGRSYSKDIISQQVIVINKAAADAIGMKDAVGKTVKLWGQDKKIIGVINDFHFESFHETVKPMLLLPAFSDSNGSYKILARVSAGTQNATVDRIRQLYQSFNPGFLFDYRWLDEAYQKQYESEQHVSALSRYFAGLTILISCLGLFGLAAYTAQRRQKEISIRKVVGASVRQITFMLSLEFVRLVGLAILIAFPVAWWIMREWLHSFAYRIDLGAGVFLLAGLAVIGIALLTVSVQSIRAALVNPANNLKGD